MPVDPLHIINGGHPIDPLICLPAKDAELPTVLLTVIEIDRVDCFVRIIERDLNTLRAILDE